MIKKTLFLLVMMMLAVGARADDLWRVRVTDASEATQLRATGVEAIARIADGYLVLAKSEHAAALTIAGLDATLIGTGLDKSRLAFDNRFDRANADRFELVFEQGDLRLYRVDWNDPSFIADQPQLSRLPDGVIPIVFAEERVADRELKSRLRGVVVPLDSLVDLVSQDTVYNYVWTLQAFGPRVQGSSANFAARDWIYDKFAGYGYDSVYLDPFSGSYNNVVCVKLGSRFPDYQVVVGGHFDAVSGSPGADDNGSGTAGVMEAARVLADIETDMTIIFIAFDAEESGLNGSWHYADAAQSAGDNIQFMFNMDMIANEGNTTDVKTYHGDNMDYPNLFNQLADSLVGLTGHLSGNISASDHWPFHQNGYTIVMAHEYIFSSVYHSYQDSTTHMDFPYMTKVIKAGLATCYAVSQTEGPLPALSFTYPGGLPEFVLPGQTTTIEVVIAGLYDGVPVPGTGTLHYNRANHGWTQVAMTELSANHYEATLLAASCFETIEYYFSAEEVSEGELTDPPPLEGVYSVSVATDQITIFADDFESDLGWTLQANWEIGVATAGGGAYGNPDPGTAISGTGVLGYDLGDDYENNMAEMHATSPAIDCSDLVSCRLRFWRWLGVEQPTYDHAYLRVSSNGTNWTTLWSNTGTIEDGSWTQYEYDIADYVDGESTVYIRFTMGETDGSWLYCGWNVDDLQLIGYTCDDGAPIIATTTLPDWTAGVAYTQQLDATGGTGVLSWSDRDGDLAGTGLTLASNGLLSGTVAASGTISFTAVVIDEAMATDEQALSLTINPAVTILTVNLPDGEVGVPYYYQVQAEGGTGDRTWSDKYGDLDDTGIALLPTGVLDGAALEAGTIVFTGEVTDEVGSIAEREFSILIVVDYLCGDADNDGIGPNIADLVYLVTYMFQDGTAPEEMGSVDVNGNGVGPDIEDLVYLVTYMFQDGPDLICQ